MTMEIIRCSTSESSNRVMTGRLNAPRTAPSGRELRSSSGGSGGGYNVGLSREEAARASCAQIPLGLFLESAETISIHDHPDNY